MSRQDIFTFIHKGLRALIYDQGRRLMQTDFADISVSQAAMSELKHSLEWLEKHGQDEDEHIFSVLTAHAPALAEEFIAQHETIHKMLADVGDSIDRIGKITVTAERIQAGTQLYREFNDLIAYYLMHMNQEETRVQPVLWEHMTDEMIGELRSNIQRSIAPDLLKEQLTWAIGATNNSELVGLLKGLKASGSQAVVDNVVKIAQNALPQERWQYVRKTAEI